MKIRIRICFNTGGLDILSIIIKALNIIKSNTKYNNNGLQINLGYINFYGSEQEIVFPTKVLWLEKCTLKSGENIAA